MKNIINLIKKWITFLKDNETVNVVITITWPESEVQKAINELNNNNNIIINLWK